MPPRRSRSGECAGRVLAGRPEPQQICGWRVCGRPHQLCRGASGRRGRRSAIKRARARLLARGRGRNGSSAKISSCKLYRERCRRRAGRCELSSASSLLAAATKQPNGHDDATSRAPGDYRAWAVRAAGPRLSCALPASRGTRPGRRCIGCRSPRATSARHRRRGRPRSQAARCAASRLSGKAKRPERGRP